MCNSQLPELIEIIYRPQLDSSRRAHWPRDIAKQVLCISIDLFCILPVSCLSKVIVSEFCNF